MLGDKFIKEGKIIDGQYTISIDLKGLSESMGIDRFKSDFKKLKEQCGEDLNDICRLEGDELRYRSETILPAENRVKNRKILIVFGNPAVHGRAWCRTLIINYSYQQIIQKNI